MKISVGVIAYNEEKNIERLITSLINQKLERFKIKEIIFLAKLI